MVMKKLKTNSYLQQNKFVFHINTGIENDSQNSSNVIGHRNGGFYSHFWLYLFLYTFFVIEKQENYLTDKREFRSNYFKHIYNLK